MRNIDSLILAFIDRERQDFGDHYGPEWTEVRVAELERRLKEMPPARELVFESLGNTGVVLRKLEIEPPKPVVYKWDGAKVTIIFCPCGKQDHSFSISHDFGEHPDFIE